MRSRSRRRSVPEKWCFSAARETDSGRKANPAGTFCASARFAWIAMRTRCLSGSKRSGLAFATKAIAAASFAPSNLGAKRSEEHTSELQSRLHLVCRLLLEKKNHKQ